MKVLIQLNVFKYKLFFFKLGETNNKRVFKYLFRVRVVCVYVLNASVSIIMRIRSFRYFCSNRQCYTNIIKYIKSNNIREMNISQHNWLNQSLNT